MLFMLEFILALQLGCTCSTPCWKFSIKAFLFHCFLSYSILFEKKRSNSSNATLHMESMSKQRQEKPPEWWVWYWSRGSCCTWWKEIIILHMKMSLSLSRADKRCETSLWRNTLSGKQNIMQEKEEGRPTPAIDRAEQSGAEAGLRLIWPAFVLRVRKRMMSARCFEFSELQARSESRCAALTANWPATKDVPPREMRDFGLGSRFVTMCSITLSTVSIRPLTTGEDVCSTTKCSVRALG